MRNKLDIVIGIGTNRADTLPITLASIASQKLLPNEIVICNQGFTNIMDSYQVRIMIDILSNMGVSMVIKRFVSEKGAPLIKKRVLEHFLNSKSKHCLIMDDDHLINPGLLENTILLLKKNELIVPIFLVPNNEALGIENFIELNDKDSQGKLFELYTTRNINKVKELTFPVLDGCMAFKKESLFKVMDSINFKLPEMVEISREFLKIGKGVISGDFVWHLIIPNKNSVYNNMSIQEVENEFK